MADRELLEKAARAGGIAIEYRRAARSNVGSSLTKFKVTGWHGPFLSGTEEPWNPLTDDGDALRLAVGLGFINPGCWPDASCEMESLLDEGTPDWNFATRRAIVKAAARLAAAHSQDTQE